MTSRFSQNARSVIRKLSIIDNFEEFGPSSRNESRFPRLDGGGEPKNSITSSNKPNNPDGNSGMETLLNIIAERKTMIKDEVSTIMSVANIKLHLLASDLVKERKENKFDLNDRKNAIDVKETVTDMIVRSEGKILTVRNDANANHQGETILHNIVRHLNADLFCLVSKNTEHNSQAKNSFNTILDGHNKSPYEFLNQQLVQTFKNKRVASWKRAAQKAILSVLKSKAGQNNKQTAYSKEYSKLKNFLNVIHNCEQNLHIKGPEILDLTNINLMNLNHIFDCSKINLMHIIELDLSNNSLRYIHPCTFDQLHQMKIVKLNDNPLNFMILPQLFEHNTKLEEIEMTQETEKFDDGRRKLEIDPGAFSTLKKLKIFLCKNNRIVSNFTKEHFKFNNRLEKIDVSGNLFEEFHYQPDEPVKECQVIFRDNANLKFFTCKKVKTDCLDDDYSMEEEKKRVERNKSSPD